jgi:hypothetical protein
MSAPADRLGPLAEQHRAVDRRSGQRPERPPDGRPDRPAQRAAHHLPGERKCKCCHDAIPDQKDSSPRGGDRRRRWRGLRPRPPSAAIVPASQTPGHAPRPGLGQVRLDHARALLRMDEAPRPDHDPAMPRRQRPPQPEQHHLPRPGAPSARNSTAPPPPRASRMLRIARSRRDSSAPLRLVPIERAPHAAQEPQAVAARAERRRPVPIGRAEPGARRAHDLTRCRPHPTSARPSRLSPGRG